MRYYNRAGAEIAPEEWLALTRSPNYCLVARVEAAGCRVQCHWVGVGIPGEDPPLLFLVEMLKQRKVESGCKVVSFWRVVFSEWYATQGEAEAEVKELLETVQLGV